MKTFKSLIPILTAASLACAASAQTATVAVQPPTASVSATLPDAPANLSYGVTQVLKLQQGGLGKDVLVNYVNNANSSFSLRADDIVYLHKVGVPEEVINAMMDKERSRTSIADSTPAPAPVQQPVAQQQPQSTMVNPPAPTTTVVTQPPVVYTSPTYVYDSAPYYPYYYGRPYYYGAPLSLNFGFGWGGHWGGHGGWGGGWHGGHHR